MAAPYDKIISALEPSLYWRLDEHFGARDLSGNERHGTAGGGVVIGGSAETPSVFETAGATDFDGTDDRITAVGFNPFQNGDTMVVCGWARRDASAATHTLFSGNDNGAPFLQLDSGGQNVRFLALSGGTPTIFSSAWPGNGRWVFWGLSFAESVNLVGLWINNAVGNIVGNADQFSTSAAFQVGCRGSSVSPFDGKIGRVAVFEHALAQGDFLALYKAGATGFGRPFVR